MIKNFFLIAIRNISKNPIFSFINIIGLAIGLASALLILLWVQHELSYEKYNLNGKSIFRVEQDQFYSGRRYHVTVTPHPSGPVWMEKIPEIKEQTRISRQSRILFRVGDIAFYESRVIAADSGLFRMFTIPFLLGDSQTALNAPHSIVITENLAKKYFGEENPMGKSITLENKYQFMVTGVIRELPSNSNYIYDAVVPYSFVKETGGYSNSWGSNSILTFVQVEEGIDLKAVNDKLTAIVKENNSQSTNNFMLFPLFDIHLRSQFGFYESNGPIISVIIFGLIAVFIILIACINFINLSTAKGSSRGKEIGIKKVAGADQMSMVVQFMFESLFLVVLAMVIALILTGLSLGMFNYISGKSFNLSDLLHTEFIISFIAVGLLAGFFSGIYPALYLSSFKPVSVLKGETLTGKGNGRLRQMLVVLQFTLSILIAVSAVFLYKQLKFLQEKELGYNKDNLISIQMAPGIKTNYYALKRELMNETLIQGVTASTQSPVRLGSNSGGARWDGKDPEKQVLIGFNAVEYDYLKTMQIELLSGRDFSRDFPGDMRRDTTGNFLVNEEVVRIMDIGDPVGKNFSFIGQNGTIIGVMKNFHFKGADQEIEPMAFALSDTSFLYNILIRLTPGNIPESIKTVERIWKSVIPEYPLDYTFIDQDYDNLFRAQLRLTSLLKWFTVLAVIIACLGLYGLASYSAQRRTNEVALRKVMGAGSLTVMFSLIREFLVLVLISIVIAIPVGWFVVDKLLGLFAYRIEKSILVFVSIAIGAILVALATVTYQAYKATGINPAEALKLE